VLPRGIAPPFKGTFLQIATLSFEKQLRPFSPTETTVGTCIPTHSGNLL